MQNKKEQWAVLKRLMSYLKPYGLLTFLALSFLLATTVIKSVIPLVASHFIDQYLSNLNQLAVTVLLVYYGLYILQTMVQYVGNLLFARVSYSIVRDIRRDAFANMEKLGMSYFDKTPAGSIVSRLTNDTETISDMFSGILSSFISAVFIFLTTLYTMLVLDFRLTTLVLIFLPLIFLLVNLYRKKSVKIIEKTRSLLSDINSKLAENIEGIRIIQAFNQEKRLQAEFDEINQEHLVYANRSVALDALFLRPAMSLLKLLGYAVLMAYFGYRGFSIGITAGTMYAFIQELPQGYDSPVSERGSSFSTGQRQLLAFARTVASQPKILILDEATANIDSETESLVQASLAKMRQGRTTIAIAHRLSTIQDANCIYVLDKGRIIESGTHEELLALGGTYHKMYSLQAGAMS
ncbi:ABC transporter transmembrane domain-containing protein [Streptococcus pneumoniae]|nr:ABC transporter transmembrane domain-containing protein [Streptococcus pneumoniae]